MGPDIFSWICNDSQIFNNVSFKCDILWHCVCDIAVTFCSDVDECDLVRKLFSNVNFCEILRHCVTLRDCVNLCDMIFFDIYIETLLWIIFF